MSTLEELLSIAGMEQHEIPYRKTSNSRRPASLAPAGGGMSSYPVYQESFIPDQAPNVDDANDGFGEPPLRPTADLYKQLSAMSKSKNKGDKSAFDKLMLEFSNIPEPKEPEPYQDLIGASILKDSLGDRGLKSSILEAMIATEKQSDDMQTAKMMKDLLKSQQGGAAAKMASSDKKEGRKLQEKMKNAENELSLKKHTDELKFKLTRLNSETAMKLEKLKAGESKDQLDKLYKVSADMLKEYPSQRAVDDMNDLHEALIEGINRASDPQTISDVVYNATAEMEGLIANEGSRNSSQGANSFFGQAGMDAASIANAGDDYIERSR